MTLPDDDIRPRRLGRTARRLDLAADAQLLRGIGLWGAVALVIGNVIGSGIFLTTGTMVAELPSTTLVLAAWVAGGSAGDGRRPHLRRDGVDVPALRRPLRLLERGLRHRWSGFLFGWACLLVILTGSVATVAVGFAEYFSYFFPALGTDRVLATFAMPWGPWSISAGQLVAAGSIVIITAINYVGRAERQPHQHGADRGQGRRAGGAAAAGHRLHAGRSGVHAGRAARRRCGRWRRSA